MFDNLTMRFTTEWRNFLLITFIVLLESIQLVLVVHFISGFVSPANAFNSEILAEWRNLYRPEHEPFLYRSFVLGALLLQALALWKFRAELCARRLTNRLISFAAVESILIFLLLTALYKTIIYDYRDDLAQTAYVILLGIALLTKVFWRHVREVGANVYTLLISEDNRPALRKIADWAFPLFVIALIYIPHYEAVLARMFVGEQFHHWDTAFMAPAYAYLKGCILNIDTMAQYGIGWSVVIAHLSKLFGPFSFTSAFLALLWSCIVYFLASYFLLRIWWNSPLLALTAILVGIRVQMFHTGVFPLVYTYPSATVMRFFYDVFFLIAILMHIRNSKQWYLMLAGIICGLQIFHLVSEGVYLTAAFYAYLVALLIVPHLRSRIYRQGGDAFILAGYAVLPVATAFVLFWIVTGQHIWRPEFWQNMGEFIVYFLSGFGTEPIYKSLQQHLFLASIMGFLIPLLYVVTMLTIGTLCYLRKIADEHLFAVVLSIYGLCIYHYYVVRSEVTSYYAVGLPFVYLIGYWIYLGLQTLNAGKRRHVSIALAAVALYALTTNHNFIGYPNIFNLSQNPMTDPRVAQLLPTREPYFNHLFRNVVRLPVNSLGTTDEELYTETDFASDDQLVAYYRRAFDFQKDAQLIRSLTRPDDKVALFSSFDIKILMDADRKPLFYYFPITISHPMKLRGFLRTCLYTKGHYAKTIKQLETAESPYVFMEKIFLNREVPDAYYEQYPDTMALLDYIHRHYAPEKFGEYLVAMKRKEEPNLKTIVVEEKKD